MMDEPILPLLAVLRTTRALLAPPERWTSRDYAEDGNGDPVPVPVGSRHAMRFSLLGALVRSAPGRSRILVEARDLFRDVRPDLYRKLSGDRPAMTHDEVIELLDAGITLLAKAATRLVVKQSGFIAAVGAPTKKGTGSASG